MKINQKKAFEYGATLGGAVVGTKTSKAVNTYLPPSMKNPAVHGLIAIGTIVVASMIKGNTLASQVGRGVAIGVGIDQGNTAINSVVTPMLPASDGTTTSVMLDAAFEKPTALQGVRGLKAAYSPAVLQSFNRPAVRTGVAINLAE